MTKHERFAQLEKLLDTVPTNDLELEFIMPFLEEEEATIGVYVVNASPTVKQVFKTMFDKCDDYDRPTDNTIELYFNELVIVTWDLSGLEKIKFFTKILDDYSASMVY